jgi:pyruvate/2-oxoglutarate dehydrogenase complex dihydrolipoamide dehydrogenase (E3) component
MTHDIIVIGGGAAGLTAAGMAAHIGAKVVMIERHRLGGDCTWTGCVPSKTLLHAAHLAHSAREAERFGIARPTGEVDFAAVMAHVRRVREEVFEDADHPDRFRAMGIDVSEGEARFVDAHTVEVQSAHGSERFTAKRIVIVSGARPVIPPIEGLGDAPYLTSDTLFELDTLPPRLAIIGAGPIGTEMAQAFQRLGSRVTVIDMAERILGNDDAELAGMLRQKLEEEGVAYHLGASVRRVERRGVGVAVHLTRNEREVLEEADALLVATGRRPSVESLGLEEAGVVYSPRGITVDRRCRTNVRHIYAAGDVTGRYQLTHMSEHMAKIAVSNALLRVPMKLDTKHVSWATYTDPELAHVGTTEARLRERGTRFRTYRFPYSKVDRAITEGATTGLIKVHAREFDGKILGASVLGRSGGELICEYAVAMKNGLTLRKLADTIHPYPSYGQAARRAADQWYVQKQSPRTVRFLQRLFGFRGRVVEVGPDDVV